MELATVYVLTKRLAADITRILSRTDISLLAKDEAKVLQSLKRDLADARLDVRDYELAETRAEQGKLADVAKQRLESIRSDMLLASQFNVFGTVDIAQLTATIDRITTQLD